MAAAPPLVVMTLSVMGIQLGYGDSKLLVFQMPPLDESTYMVLGSVGWGMMLRSRPLSVLLSLISFSVLLARVGPIDCQTGTPAGAVAPGASWGYRLRWRVHSLTMRWEKSRGMVPKRAFCHSRRPSTVGWSSSPPPSARKARKVWALRYPLSSNAICAAGTEMTPAVAHRAPIQLAARMKVMVSLCLA